MTQFQRTLAFVLTHAIDAHSSEPLYYPTPQDPYSEFANEGLDPLDNFIPYPQDPYTDFANEGSDPYENYPDPYTKDFIGESSDLSGWEFVVDPLDS